jgi:hypothetical protein
MRQRDRGALSARWFALRRGAPFNGAVIERAQAALVVPVDPYPRLAAAGDREVAEERDGGPRGDCHARVAAGLESVPVRTEVDTRGVRCTRAAIQQLDSELPPARRSGVPVVLLVDDANTSGALTQRRSCRENGYEDRE